MTGERGGLWSRSRNTFSPGIAARAETWRSGRKGRPREGRGWTSNLGPGQEGLEAGSGLDLWRRGQEPCLARAEKVEGTGRGQLADLERSQRRWGRLWILLESRGNPQKGFKRERNSQTFNFGVSV